MYNEDEDENEDEYYEEESEYSQSIPGDLENLKKEEIRKLRMLLR